MPRPPRTLILAVPVLLMACLTDDCPFALDAPTATPRADGGYFPGSVVDIGAIGSSSGASWGMTFSSDVAVSVHGPKKTTTKTIPANSVGQVGDCTINLASFCILPTTLCPQKVLPTLTTILQSKYAPTQPLLGFNRVGPLEPFKDKQGLGGLLNGTLLTVPLGTDAIASQKNNPCALGQASIIRATVSDKAGLPADTAVLMQGTITLAYTDECFALSGTSVVPTGTQVELTVAFTGRRK